ELIAAALLLDEVHGFRESPAGPSRERRHAGGIAGISASAASTATAAAPTASTSGGAVGGARCATGERDGITRRAATTATSASEPAAPLRLGNRREIDVQLLRLHLNILIE